MNLLRKYLTNQGPKAYFKRKFNINKFLINSELKYKSFGKKNPDKIFYVINRSPGAGLFSNLTFVLNQLKFCEDCKFIPIIDMKNFTTIYNEEKKIDNSFNAWDYYFEKINNYRIKDIYKSTNLIFSNSKFQKNMHIDIQNKKLNKAFKKIKIKKKILNHVKNMEKKNFLSNDNVLGVHFRGSTYKTARRHAYPATIPEMIKNIDQLIKKYKYNKIFLVTEEQKYLDALKKRYKEKLIYYPSFRMNKIDSFRIYPRKYHRYKLGKEAIIEMLMLSKCDGITYVKSNIVSAAKKFSNKKQNDHEIFFGYNSRNIYISRWKWYLKYYLPFIFGKIKRIKKFN
jgi:hypothetical protein